MAYELYTDEAAQEAGQQAGYIPLCGVATYASVVAACVIYRSEQYEGTNFSGASFQIGYIAASHTAEACRSLHTTPGNRPDFYIKPQQPTKFINGVKFVHGVFGGAAMGHYSDMDFYRAFHNGVCWELSVLLTTTEFASYEPGDIREFTPADDQRVKGDLNKIVNSFKFLN
jgi:hypothetical protein